VAIDPIQEVRFSVDDPTPAVVAVADLIETGTGWVNLAPADDDGVDPPRRNLFAAIFSARGPLLPLATVSPADTGGGRLALGLQHNGGQRAISTLAESGHPLPDGWERVSDHPRRGLVVSAPAGTQPDVVVTWLLEAAERLTRVEMADAWVARVYRK
jgi:hypothetical protein